MLKAPKNQFLAQWRVLLLWGRGTSDWRETKMAEGMSSVAIGCHCDDSEDPFPPHGWYSNTWRCEFEVDCVVSE